MPIIGRYLPTDLITAVIWPAGANQDSALSTVPTVTWLDAPNGIAAYFLSASQTQAIPPGQYRTSAFALHSGISEDILEADLIIDGTGSALGLPMASPVVGPGATELALVPTVYCTDEDIAVRMMLDYTQLRPDSQMMAWGSDGVFSSSDPWTLTSPSNNFTTQLPAVWSRQGAGYLSQVGYVVWLKKPQSAFPGGGILMAIAAASGSSLTLRRLGMPSGWGVAPAPAAGLVGVDFQLATYYPQIERATYRLNEKYNINATRPGRAPANFDDMRVLNSATIALVLMDRYSDQRRVGGGDYGNKYELYKNELSDLEAQLTIRWNTGFNVPTRANQFAMRVRR